VIFLETLHKFLTELYGNAVFIGFLKMKLESADRDEVVFSMELARTIHANVHNTAHGGVLMTFADTAMGALCGFNNKKVVTTNINMSFFAPVLLETKIFARAFLLHNGHKTMTAEADITDSSGRLLNKAAASFFVLGKWIE